jgi:hypothetical protein
MKFQLPLRGLHGMTHPVQMTCIFLYWNVSSQITVCIDALYCQIAANLLDRNVNATTHPSLKSTSVDGVSVFKY